MYKNKFKKFQFLSKFNLYANQGIEKIELICYICIIIIIATVTFEPVPNTHYKKLTLVLTAVLEVLNPKMNFKLLQT